MKRILVNALICASFASPAMAHSPDSSTASANNTLVIIPAYGEVKQTNDQVQLTFFIEEQDKNKASAASRVNQKMKQGVEILKKQDSSAVLQTRGYYTYPIYPEETAATRGTKRQPISWRVGQYLDMTTTNLNQLPQTVAAAQSLLGLDRLSFSLQNSTRKKLDSASIAAAHTHLTERIAAIAHALGRNPASASIETVDLEGGSNRDMEHTGNLRMMSAAPAMRDDNTVAEPSFEPGETNIVLRILGKVRFK